jgi:hypothetical protein
MDSFISGNEYEGEMSGSDIESDIEDDYEDPFLDEPKYISKDVEIEKKIIKKEIETGAPVEDLLALEDDENDESGDDISDHEEGNEVGEKEEVVEDTRDEIQKYKKMNSECFSKSGMIGLLSNLVTYIKQGGQMLDGRSGFSYPNTTEESYAVESIILQTHPFVYLENGHVVELNYISQLICLKKNLRVVLHDTKNFFTEDFRNNFPVLIKNIFEDSISKEELDEIDRVRSKYNIIKSV